MKISQTKSEYLTLSQGSYTIDIKIEGFTGAMISRILLGWQEGSVKLGTHSAPTQHDMEKALQDWNRIKLSKREQNEIVVEIDL